ncbi:MAG: 50S ribosomal protein L23 [Candidatus Dadabacteria bacterium]|nr:MAG: 50S ribosomal protein L23 [Candidatus Dadabacteria bacterium]
MARKQKSEAKAADYQMIIKPVVTEKSSIIGELGGRYVFKVKRTATKTEIKEAIERIFDVHVERVNTLNMIGKPKRNIRRFGRRASYKKAYVTLREGESINVVEGL